MDIQEIREFFNRLAPTWDEHMVIDEEVVERILENAEVKKGQKILDVACGTGVMIPFYLKKGVSFVTGIDLSEKMCEIAESKFDKEKVRIICDDVLTHSFDERFDCIMVYNAFPHFTDQKLLIDTLSDLLNENGILSIAHGMSREKILAHHDNVKDVSDILPEIEDLKRMMEEKFHIIAAVSDERMYQAAGRKR